jgi:hypothetical protein
MARSRAAVRLVLALAVALAATAAGAQVQWYEHYQRGLDLAAQASWEPALRELEAAARVEPRPRKRAPTFGRNFVSDYDPHYHLARCLTELDRYPAAALQLRAAYKANVTPRPQLDELRARLERAISERTATAPANGRLAVSTRPVGAHVTLDGAVIGTTPLGPVPVAAGEHVVGLSARGFRPLEARVTVAAAGTYSLDRDLLPEPTPALAAPTAVVPAPTPSAPRRAVPAPAAAAIAAPVAAPESVPPTPVAAATALPAATVPALLAALALAVAAGVLAWRAHRRRLDPAHTPTSVLDATPTQVKAGMAMGAYDLVGILGRGGMGTTYRATRRSDGSEVAVKVPHEGCFTDPTFLARFLREGRLGEQLHHPRIVRILEADEHGGRPFLAMELLAGRTLKQELRERRPLPLRRALGIAADIAEALDYAHVKGVVHRDLKPENVMVLPDGAIKVMDFGIARLEGQEGLTSSQFFLGTPLYAAPEMIEPKGIDHRVDLYSLGVIMFEMLQGTVPFSADSPFKVLQMHQHDPLPARGALPHPVPERVWRVVERLCAKRPADRYPSAEALLVELHALLRDFSSLGVERG